MGTKQNIKKIIQAMKSMVPTMLGILLLISMVSTAWEKQIPKIFSGNLFLDPLFGALAGSISFGMPLSSYVIGGEMLANGISLLAIIAFVMAWTTVGITMLPLETKFLGKRFALSRNIINFVLAITIAILTVGTLKLIQ